MKVILLALLLALPAYAEKPWEQKWSFEKVPHWKVSLVALGTANAMDFASSVGKWEANPFMRRADGRLAVRRAAASKVAATVGTAFGQWLLVRKWPKLKKLFAAQNYIMAGATTYIAGRNWRTH